MGKHRSISEKIQIIESAKENGLSFASRVYGVSHCIIIRWRRRYEEKGKSGLQRINKTPSQYIEPSLEEENKILKQMLADKEIELEIKNALLKKTSLVSQKERK